MFSQIHFMPIGDDASLAYRFLPASGAPRGIILICHGLAEHSGRYAAFAEFLAAHGYHIYAHDHRGHGHTTAPDAPLGRFAWRNGSERVLEDIALMRNKAATDHPDLPILLFGHSMGGLMALNAAQTLPDAFNGVAIWSADFYAPTALAGFILKTEKMLKGSDVPSQWLPRLTFESWAASIPDAKTRFDWLSSNRDNVAAYQADPLCGFNPSVSLWLDLVALIAQGRLGWDRSKMPKSMPFHVAGGGQDPVTKGGQAILRLANDLKKHGCESVETVIYPQIRHELMHEQDATRAMSDLVAWCHKISG